MPGPVLGAGDARPPRWCEAEEGPGASVQPAAHRVPADAVRNADGWHPLQTLQAAKSHGKKSSTGRCNSVVVSGYLLVEQLNSIYPLLMATCCSAWQKHQNGSQTQEWYLHEIFRSNCFSRLTVFFQVNGDIPPRLKKSAHEIILEFIRSRPPLNPVSSTHDARILSSRLYKVVEKHKFLVDV